MNQLNSGQAQQAAHQFLQQAPTGIGAFQVPIGDGIGSEVKMALEEIVQVSAAFDDLVSRMHPALRPACPVNSAGQSPPQSPSCDLALAIVEIRSKVRNLGFAIGEVSNRLAL